ncbi:hypothetical protein [Thiocystis violacea]|uniref:hypothetical protein n=1 Tax=Thiocystis violacea TaxID=13725 RepID=UPI0019062AA3|nr:hypothetical protein [Thiocystis violacea]MBK1718670.1 hypothetical protein [Thiocystis violacea]
MVKVRANGPVTEVKTRVVFGSPERVAAYLADSPTSGTINTSFVERDNLTQRQSNRRLARKTNGFSKDIAWLEKQLWLSTAGIAVPKWRPPMCQPHPSQTKPSAHAAPPTGSGRPRQVAWGRLSEQWWN